MSADPRGAQNNMAVHGDNTLNDGARADARDGGGEVNW